VSRAFQEARIVLFFAVHWPPQMEACQDGKYEPQDGPPCRGVPDDYFRHGNPPIRKKRYARVLSKAEADTDQCQNFTGMDKQAYYC
jgi:hypothetical protein